MMYKPKNPLGYRNLLTWKQGGEIYRRTKDFTRIYLDKIKDSRLIGHMNDSARSIQRNIEEGFKRATTKEYIAFLGFSRGSLEELKRDFEELKREHKEGIRGNSGEKWKIKNDKRVISDKGAMGEIEGLLNIIYGEDCMLGRQIASLEKKMFEEKTLPQKEMIKHSWNRARSADKKFWQLAKEKFGIEKDEKGRIKRGWQ